MKGNKRVNGEVTRKIAAGFALPALVILAGVAVRHVAGTAVAAQTTAAQPVAVPRFQVDPNWPKVPAKWKLGDVSSIGVDAQNRIWVRHRPRTLPASDAAMAAPPVLVFDEAGNFIQAWGGAGSGYEWPEREHGIHIDYKGFVWIGGHSCPTNRLSRPKPGRGGPFLKFDP